MKKLLFSTLFALLFATVAQAQLTHESLQVFLSKFSEIPATGLSIAKMPSPEILTDKNRETYLNVSPFVESFPIGKIHIGNNLTYLFYLTYRTPENNTAKQHEMELRMIVLSTEGVGGRSGEQLLKMVSYNTLQESIDILNKFQIIPNATNKAKVIIVDDANESTEREYLPETEKYRVRKVK